MKKNYFLLNLLILINISIHSIDNTENNKSISINNSVKNENHKEELIDLNYNNENITNAINQLAAKKRINILFPQPSGKIPAKITFNKYDMTIDEAWDLLITALDLSGYTLVKKDNFYEIEKNDTVTKEPLEVYINSIDKLQNSDQRIRYIYFLENISISDSSSSSFVNLDQILKDMIGNENEGGTYILDGTTNSIIIVGKISSIKAVMKIIEELDTAGFPEAIEVVSLVNTKADYISKIITQLIPSNQEPHFRYGPFPPKQLRIGGYYLSEQTKVVPIKSNSLAVLGPPDSVQRIKDFIEKHLDLPIESEKSIIHVKNIQYLNADDLAPAIQNFVKSKSSTAQAEGAPSEKDTLANVIVLAEKQVQATTIQPTTPAQQTTGSTTPNTTTAPITGGNRLIVAARGNDWHAINRLIEQLDQPQMQVAIEVLVTDILISDEDLIGAQNRNALEGNNPSYVNYQADHLSATPWLNFINNDRNQGITPQGLASDLLRYPNPTSSPINIATLAAPGSTILSFKNGNGISYVLQLLQNYDSATILSQPFVVTRNNLQANISVATEIYKEMGVDTQSTGGPIVRERKPMKADLTVNILPRISKASEINLEILVNVNDFEPGTGNDVITTRQVRTNANLNNREVLVIGGLSRTTTVDTLTETPIIGKIPIIGSLFRRKSQNIDKSNLTIFISPTIIRPRLQGGMDIFTKNKVCFIKNEINDAEIDLLGSNFEQLRDPITRVYFSPLGKQINSAIDYYTEQKAYKSGTEETAKEIALTNGVTESIGLKNIAEEDEQKSSERLRNIIKDDDNPLLKNHY